jgi:hypothetical protein
LWKAGDFAGKVLQPADPPRASAAHDAALGPPQDVSGVLVGLALADAAAAERAEPEIPDDLARRDVAPGSLRSPSYRRSSSMTGSRYRSRNARSPLMSEFWRLA